MKRHHQSLIAIAIASLSILASCGGKKSSEPATTSTSGLATICCDATFENILAQEIDVFEYTYNKASIIPYYVPENSAIDSLLDFKTKLAITTRPLTTKELDYLKSNKKQVHQQQIAVDAIALIVNPDNPVNVLSKKEIAEILTGKINKWTDVEVMPKGFDDIKVVFDNQGSSTVRYMRDSLLNGAELGPNVFAQKTPQGVFDAVATNKNAIGVIGVSWISSDMDNREMTREELAEAVESSDSTEVQFSSKIKVLKVRGNDEVTAYKPYQYYIYTGQYPLYRQVYMIVAAPGGTLSRGFYSFVTGFIGQKIMLRTGILPKVIQPQLVQIN